MLLGDTSAYLLRLISLKLMTAISTAAGDAGRIRAMATQMAEQDEVT